MDDYQRILVGVLVWLVGFGGVMLLGAVAIQLLSLPFMRQQRAQLFVDLLEGELKRGAAPEPAILRLSQCQDRSLSVRFFLLAAHLESGLKLDEALDRVPRFLPAGVAATIQAGCRTGNLLQLLPACRYQLKSATDQVANAHNYLGLTIMLYLPAWLAAIWFIGIFVMPRFRSIAAEMTPGWSTWAIENFGILGWLALIPFTLFALAAFMFAVGPRLRLTVIKVLPAAFVDWLGGLRPWARHRARRDFSLALARMLDGGMPEPEAVKFAGAATGNARFRQLGELIAAELAAGAQLPQALGRIDAAREFQWRWRTAAQTGVPFERALEGWHESLNAHAIQAEAAAANFATALLIVLNGTIVGIAVVGVFQFLTGIIDQAVLW